MPASGALLHCLRHIFFFFCEFRNHKVVKSDGSQTISVSPNLIVNEPTGFQFSSPISFHSFGINWPVTFFSTLND